VRLEHLEPGGATLGILEHLRADVAGLAMAVEGDLIFGRESAVDDVGEHGLVLQAIAITATSAGCRASELIKLRHLDHLSFCTLQEPCQFTSAAIDAAFDGTLRNTEDLGDFLIVHIFEVAEDDGLAELGRELFEGGLYATV